MQEAVKMEEITQQSKILAIKWNGGRQEKGLGARNARYGRSKVWI